MKQLKGDEQDSVYQELKKYVSSVLKGEFPHIRYQVEGHPHLQKVFGCRKDLKDLWTEKGEESFVFTEKAQQEPIDYKSFIHMKTVKDKHLDLSKFPLLKEYLTNEAFDKKEMQNEENESVKFQWLVINFCKGKVDKAKFLKEIHDFNITLGEFENDLKVLQSQKTTGKYTINESDEACDLLLIGTEIQGSCQRVNGTPRLNKCLVSYLMHGEIRPIVVKNCNGEIVARSLLRLMWDEKNQVPVILQERRYSNIENADVAKAIDEWAIKKAKKMQLPLVGKEINNNAPLYKGSVEFLGGTTSFVYSDASGGVLDGKKGFTTKGCRQLYYPKKRS